MIGKFFEIEHTGKFFDFESLILGFAVCKNVIWLSWIFLFFSEQKDDETTEQTWLMFYMLSMKVRMCTWIFRRKAPRTRNKHGMWNDQ